MHCNQRPKVVQVINTKLAEQCFNYFVAISAGEIKIDNTLYYAISASTPIAKLILSKEISDTITFRDASFTITEIL